MSKISLELSTVEYLRHKYNLLINKQHRRVLEDRHVKETREELELRRIELNKYWDRNGQNIDRMV
jgi:hypothetical protein